MDYKKLDSSQRPPSNASHGRIGSMSCIIESNRTWTLLDCSDSDLSISANVLGILTFAVALLATYLAFFLDVRDIPTAADDYSNDIRSLHDQLWAIGDIHEQLAKAVAQNGDLRISDVHLQSRLKQGQAESLKDARKFLDEYSAAYQSVFTDYFKKHRWLVRLKWLVLQQRVAHFKKNASILRETLTLDLLAVTLNMNIALQQQIMAHETQKNTLEDKLDYLAKIMTQENRSQADSPPISPSPPPDSASPTAGLTIPAFHVSGPANNRPDSSRPGDHLSLPPSHHTGARHVGTEERQPRTQTPQPSLSRSPSPFSPGRSVSP